MTDKQDLTRRELLLLLVAAWSAVAIPDAAQAKDGSSDGGSSDGDNSGHGGGGDDGDDDGDDNDHDDGDHNSARDAVREGRAISLSKAMSILKDTDSGRVLEVKLSKRSVGFEYRFKVLGTNGKVKTIKMDAATGRIRGFLGM